MGLAKTIVVLTAALSSLVAGYLLLKTKKLYLIGAIGTSLGIFLFAINNNLSSFLALWLLTGICSSFLNIPLSVMVLNGFDSFKKPWQEKYHLLIERDLVLGFARILNYLLLFLFFIPLSKSQQIQAAQHWMILIAFLPLVLGYLLKSTYLKTK